MAHYVMSDLHGDLARFRAMLERIGFCETDTLYIIGDLFDRGPEPVALLEEVMAMPNAVMLLGNHEYMCMQCMSPDAQEIDFRRWNRNNNTPTKRGLAALPQERFDRVMDFLWSRPLHLTVEVGGRKFWLVHGFPGETMRDQVWNRPEPDTPNPVPGYTLIVGHTPVCCLGRDEEQEAAYCREVAARGEHLKIYHAPGYIDIDCGCCYPEIPGAVACLRLEDMQEFYIPTAKQEC